MSSDSQRKGDSCHEGRDTGSISVNSNLMHEISELRRNQSARGQCAQTQESPDNRPNTLAYLPCLNLYSGNDQHSSTDDEPHRRNGHDLHPDRDEHHRHHHDEHHSDRDGQHRHRHDEHHPDRDEHHHRHHHDEHHSDHDGHHHRHHHGEHHPDRDEHHHAHHHRPHHNHNRPNQHDRDSSASQPDEPSARPPNDSNNEQTTNPPSETSPSTRTSLGRNIYSDGPSYYVSANGDDKADGSKEHPFATLKRAALAMENSSIKTTTVKAGNYKMQETLHLTSKDDGVTFQFDKASGPNQAVFDGGNSIDRMIDIEGGSQITINGLRLTNFKWTGIFNHGGTVDHRDKSSQNVGSASGNRFVNNEIDHNSQTGDWTVGATGVSAAIVNDQVTPDTLVANNYIHDLQYMGIQAGRSSDLSAAAGDYSGTVISSNVIDKVMQGRHDGGAIYLWNARKQISGGEIIENNFITNYSSSTLGDGKGIYLDDGASNTIVRGNVISETDPQKSTSEAIFIHGGINNTITNNLIDLGDSGKIAALGYASSPLHPGGMTGNIFENNVIVSDFKGNQQTSGMGVTGYTYLNGYGNAARGANPQIKNNIYHNYAGGQERTDGNGIGDSSPIHETPNGLTLEGNWGPPGYSLPVDRSAALQETNSSPLTEKSSATSNSGNSSSSETLDFTPLPYAESAATIAVLPVNQIQAHINEEKKYNNLAKAGGIKKLFVGDSLTELQPVDVFQQNFGTDAAKFGVGGDKTQNLLYRLKNGELDFPANDQPKVVVMEIGTNNIGNTAASQILDGIKANINTIKSKLPNTRILLEGIYPRGTTMPPSSIMALNAEIAKLADNKSIFYTNVGGEKLLNTDGSVNTSLFRSDHVHPNAQGYAILDAALAPIVDELAS